MIRSNEKFHVRIIPGKSYPISLTITVGGDVSSFRIDKNAATLMADLLTDEDITRSRLIVCSKGFHHMVEWISNGDVCITCRMTSLTISRDLAKSLSNEISRMVPQISTSKANVVVQQKDQTDQLDGARKRTDDNLRKVFR